MSSVQITVPGGMAVEEVARTFSAYLLGLHAFGDNGRDGVSGFCHEGGKWVLDSTNDYWLIEDAQDVRLVSRYSNTPLIEAMATLFHLRYPLSRRAAKARAFA